MLKLDGFSKMVSCLSDPPQRPRTAGDVVTPEGESVTHSAAAIGPVSAVDIEREPEEYEEPSVALPFVGLANSMSGGRKGEKVMQLLTEQGIPNFDLLRLTKDEDYFEEFAECLAAMFAKVFALGKMRPDLRRLHLRILICGGDGTMSWGLSTLDRAMLHQRVIDIFSQDEEYVENLDYLLVSGKPKASKHMLGKVATTALIADQFLDASGNVLGGDISRARRLGSGPSPIGTDGTSETTIEKLKGGSDEKLPPIEIVPLPPSPMNDGVASAPAKVTTFSEAEEEKKKAKSVEEIGSSETLDVVDSIAADLLSPSPPVTPAPSDTGASVESGKSTISMPTLTQDTGARSGSRSSSSSGERGSASTDDVSTPMINRPKTIPLAPASIDALSFYQTDAVGHKTVTLLEESEEFGKGDSFRKSGDSELVPEKHMIRLLGKSKSAAGLASIDDVTDEDPSSSERASSVPSMPRRGTVSMSELIIQRAMSLWRNKKSSDPEIQNAEPLEEWTVKTTVESGDLTIHTAPREERKGSKSHRSGVKGRDRGRSKDRRGQPTTTHLSSSQSRRFVTAELVRSTIGPEDEEEEDDLTQTLNAPFGYGDSDDSDSEASSSLGAELSMADHELITRERQDAAATSTQIISDLNRKMLSAMYATRYAPAFIPVPLGTGNDFSRSTGHGNIYPGSSNIPALLAQLCKPERPLTRVDRWGIKFMNDKGELLKRQTTEMLCYFSVGYTALITKRFQEAREKFPAIHDRPWKNKFAYVHIGARTGIEEVTGFHRTMNSLVTMYVDGRKVRLPKRCRSVVINNISSMADGVNFWGSAKSQGKDLKSYSEPSLGDGLLEVMASKGLYKYLQMKMGMSHYRRLAQASHIVFDVEDDLYVQLDGEAWQEGRGRIEISLLHQLPAVIGTRSKPLGPYVLA